MNTLLIKLNRWFEQAPGVLLPVRWLVLLLFIVITLVMAMGLASRFSMDMSLESWFNDDDPVKLQLDRFRSRFGSDDGVYIVYQAADGDVFSARSLALLASLHQELEAARNQSGSASPLLRIERIDSLYNVRYQTADGDTLIANRLLSHDFPATVDEREAKRQLALSQEGFELAYFSRDFRFGGIRIKTDFGTRPADSQPFEISPTADLLLQDDWQLVDDGEVILMEVPDPDDQLIEFADMQMDEYLEFMTALRAITSQEKYQDFQFYYSGNAPLMEFAMNSMAQAGVLMVLMVVVIIALLWFLFRSFSAVLWPVVVIIASAIWTIGLFSWLGITLSNMVTLSFMMILAVGIADCVHVLSTYSLYRRQGEEHRQAMAHAYRKTGVPIFLTSVTTMAGMAALLASDIPQIGVFGVCSAAGVFVAFLLTIFVLPVLLDIWHPDRRLVAERGIRVPSKRHWLQPLLDKIPALVQRHSGKIILCYGVVLLLFGYGASQVKIDSNFIELTREGSSVRVTAEIIDQHMMGGQNMAVMLDFGQADALKNPQVLLAIEQLQKKLMRDYPQYVIKTFSLSDQVKETYKALNHNDDAFKIIPRDPRLVSQLLYMFDNANPEDRRALVSEDYSVSHVSLQLKNAGSYEYTDFFQQVSGDINRVFSPLLQHYPAAEINVTGSLPLMMTLIDHISWAQLKSFAWALAIISLLLVLALASVQGGLLSVVPNILPGLFTFGAMGLLGYALDTDTLIIAPLIIGIAVDDTIHFMAHYRDAWLRTGDVQASLHSTITEVGQAVTFTTLILGVGFAVLAFSDYLGIAKTGMFGSLAILVALSCDLLLLPAIISWLKPDLGRRRYLTHLKLEERATQGGAVYEK